MVMVNNTTGTLAVLTVNCDIPELNPSANMCCISHSLSNVAIQKRATN